MVSKGRSMQTRKDKGHRGNASQFFVAGELCRRGFVAVVTLGNCPNTDVLCSDVDGKKFVHIQVKTFRPGVDKTCMVGMKAEREYGENFFWILGGIPSAEASSSFQYFVVPAKIMANKISTAHQAWLSKPGKKKDHDVKTTVRTVPLNSGSWVLEYQDRWDLIEARLR
jgi:hypothetical protein